MLRSSSSLLFFDPRNGTFTSNCGRENGPILWYFLLRWCGWSRQQEGEEGFHQWHLCRQSTDSSTGIGVGIDGRWNRSSSWCVLSNCGGGIEYMRSASSEPDTPVERTAKFSGIFCCGAINWVMVWAKRWWGRKAMNVCVPDQDKAGKAVGVWVPVEGKAIAMGVWIPITGKTVKAVGVRFLLRERWRIFLLWFRCLLDSSGPRPWTQCVPANANRMSSTMLVAYYYGCCYYIRCVRESALASVLE